MTVAHPGARFLALRHAVEQIVPLEETTVVIGGTAWPWYRVVDPDRLLDRAVQAESTEVQERLDPFWAATWRAAEGLGMFLENLDLVGKRVLELGCGSGRAGLAAAALGAHVTMTDAVELALQVARLNTWPLAERIDLQTLNWGKQTLPRPPYSIVIGADIVYDPNLFPRLVRCARHHLAPGGRVYLSEPQRHTGDKFQQWIQQQGWNLRVHPVRTHSDRQPIRVFECWLEATETGTPTA